MAARTRTPDDIVTVSYDTSAYVARFRGKSASCTWCDAEAIRRAVNKALGHDRFRTERLSVGVWRVLPEDQP